VQPALGIEGERQAPLLPPGARQDRPQQAAQLGVLGVRQLTAGRERSRIRAMRADTSPTTSPSRLRISAASRCASAATASR
jgi:hypothetical protein